MIIVDEDNDEHEHDDEQGEGYDEDDEEVVEDEDEGYILLRQIWEKAHHSSSSKYTSSHRFLNNAFMAHIWNM